MTPVISAAGTFFGYAVLAVFAQNAVFARGMGVSRLVQLVGDDDTSSLLFGLLLGLISFLNAPLAWFVNRQMGDPVWASAARPLAFVLCSFVTCAVLYLLFRMLAFLPHRRQLMDMLPNAGFNTCVVGAMLVVTVQDFTLVQCLGYGLGSGLGYLVAVLMVSEARRRLASAQVPPAFRGLPIVMVYIGILALAIYGFTGHGVAI